MDRLSFDLRKRISRFDGQEWTIYTTEDGLADNYVAAITVAPDGAVWFGSEHGLSRYLPPE